MNNAETIKSYYKLGEDINKYMNASYVIELTEKITEEGQPMTGLLNLLIDFLDSIENRKKNQSTLTLAYEIKALKHLGLVPELSNCICCGREIKTKQAFMNLSEGGITCPECRRKTIENQDNEKLIYSLDFGIVDVLKYLLSNPMKNLEKVALDEEVYRKLHRIIRNYLDYHMGIGSLKSEGFI